MGVFMTAVNITHARKNLYKLVKTLNRSHNPVHILGKNGSAVMVSEDDWKSIEETLFLVSIPGMKESIVKGMAEPLKHCVRKLDW